MDPLLAMRPFKPDGSPATLDQVNAVFHPNSGMLWRLLDDQLSPWLMRAGAGFAQKPGSALSLNPRFLDQINRAVQFSAALYPSGQLGPRLAFAVQPQATDAAIVTLSIDGASTTFSRSRTGMRPFEWVGVESQSASLAIANGAEVKTIVRTGTWAIFELFASARSWSGAGVRYTAEWEYQSAGQKRALPFEIMFEGAPVLSPDWLGRLSCERRAFVH
jgi:type VI protein secretion system component VasK